MAQTLVKLFVHIIFSTKNRADLIKPEIEDELFAYIGGISNKNKSKLIAANGTENHIHLLILMSKNIELSQLTGARQARQFEMDKDKRLEISSFPMAGRLRSIFGRIYAG